MTSNDLYDYDSIDDYDDELYKGPFEKAYLLATMHDLEREMLLADRYDRKELRIKTMQSSLSKRMKTMQSSLSKSSSSMMTLNDLYVEGNKQKRKREEITEKRQLIKEQVIYCQFI